MPDRSLSGRPRHLQVLVLSLVVLIVGVAAGIARSSDPSTPLETAVAFADEFVDVPPSTSPLAVEPPVPTPETTAPPAAPAADREAESVTTTTAPAPPAPVEVAAAAAPPAKPIVPLGKGMWLYQLSMSEGGDASKVVAKAKKIGLTHLYTRLGSSKKGFYAQDELNKLLPVAHAAGLKVIGWDFVYLTD